MRVSIREKAPMAHPKELSMYILNGMLFQVGQHEEPLVLDRGQRTGARGTGAANGAGLPINRAVMHAGVEGMLNMRQRGLKSGCCEPGERS